MGIEGEEGEMTQLMTVREVADYLRVSEKTIYRLLNRVISLGLR